VLAGVGGGGVEGDVLRDTIYLSLSQMNVLSFGDVNHEENQEIQFIWMNRKHIYLNQ